MKKLGIISANGGLSKKLIDFSKHEFDIFVIAIKGEADSSTLEGINHIWINIGEIGKAIDALNLANIKDIVFAGSLQKPDILNIKVDGLGAKLLAKIAKDKFFGDNKLLSSVTEFLSDYGFNIIGVQDILKDLVVEAKNFTISFPNEKDLNDIELAINIAKQLGKLDIGQGAIVQDGVVLGVEAVEGTNRLIERCAKLRITKNYSGVLAKCSKPDQELRMDLPTIGIDTIKRMHEAGFKGIVIEAKKSIFLDQIEVVEYANKYGMFISAIDI